VQTITVASALPRITRPVFIDGLTQSGATCGDSLAARNLLISIRGQGNAVSMSGIVLAGGGSTVQGLAISYFRAGNLISTGSTGGDLIRCNHISTRADGTTADTIASNGVPITGNPATTASLDISSPNTVIGGKSHTLNKCDGDCNVVIGESHNNNQQAVLLRFGPHTGTAFNGFTSTSAAIGGTMQGNYFGILADGNTPATAFKSSRIIFITSTDNAPAALPLPPHTIPSSGGYLIGGLSGNGSRDELAANVISGAKFRDGIDCDTGTGCASGLKIYGNYIGTGPGGVGTVDSAGRIYGNARDGIQLEGEESADIQANIIAGNGSNGIHGAAISKGTTVKNNSIGQLANGNASGNGWYNTLFAAGNPNFGLGNVTVNTNAATGNGISVGGYGAAVPNRDVANWIIDGNVILNNARAGIIAVNGSGNTTISNNTIGQVGMGNGAAGIVLMTDDNTISNNIISGNGGAGVTILRNTNPLMGTQIGAYTPLAIFASANRITSNSTFANTGLAIDLATINSPWANNGNTLAFPYAWSTGVTANNGALSVAPPTVAGGFGNRDQDYPVITSATLNVPAGQLTLSGHVGLAGGSATFSGSTVEVFQGDNSPADQNGEIYAGDGQSVAHPEGRTLLGTCTVDAAGQFIGCVLPVSSAALLGNLMLTSTATLNSATSEFGPIFSTAVLPTLTLVKVVNNTHGGTATPGSFTLTATGNNAPATVVTGAGDSTSIVNQSVPAATYTLTETNLPGYTAGIYSCVVTPAGGTASAPVASNSLNLVNGDAATCTVTNSDQPATLTLVKTVSNTQGGTATPASFTLTATGNNAPATVVTGAGGSASLVNQSVPAAMYALTETNLPGYTAGTYSCIVTPAGGTAGSAVVGNSLTLSNGEVASCTVTNSDTPATLTLVKTVNNTHGGTATTANFPLQAVGNDPAATTISGASGTPGVTAQAVPAANYTLSETNLPGYTASLYSCVVTSAAGVVGAAVVSNSLTLSTGEVATCTITNSDQAPVLVPTLSDAMLALLALLLAGSGLAAARRWRVR
jgi:Prealbumin-like fold domain/Periplasmic copper-binding protein (NosD)